MKFNKSAYCLVPLCLALVACSGGDSDKATGAAEEKSESMADKMSEMKESASQAVSKTMEQASETGAAMTEKAEEMAGEAKESLKETTGAVVDKTTEAMASAKEAVSATTSALAAKVATATESAIPHDEMMALAKKSGCLACHAIDKKQVGPAWNDVAEKYTDDAAARSVLIASVSKGSQGKWGKIPMPANSPRIPDEDIAKLVDFVLSLK